MRDYPKHLQRAIDEAESSMSGIIQVARKSLIRDAEARIDAKPLAGGVKRIIPSPNETAPSFVAKGRIAKPRGMNRLEEDYGGHLLARRSVGEVVWYAYEGITLKLADDTRYTPDWAVLLKSGEMELHEVKGPHAREDSIVKLRVTARLFPFRVLLVTRDDDGGWNEQEVRA
jgi:hypothetical protein